MSHKTHKGIREFDPTELSSIALGQNGFLVCGSTSFDLTIEAGVTASALDVKFFIAIKAIEADSIVEAQTLAQGHDLTKNSTGVYSGSIANGVTINNGDMIYGAFDKVLIAQNDYVILYVCK